MKKILTWAIFFTSLIALNTACKGDENSYENLLAAEKELIADFIKDNNINVITSLPANNLWGTNDYYKTDDGFYIHIVDTGETGTAVVTGQVVLARYYKISLKGDTIIRTWTTSEAAFPEEITFDSTSTTPLNGFHKAINIMKRHNSSAKIIVPSKLANKTDSEEVTPYFYDFKIKLTE